MPPRTPPPLRPASSLSPARTAGVRCSAPHLAGPFRMGSPLEIMPCGAFPQETPHPDTAGVPRQRAERCQDPVMRAGPAGAHSCDARLGTQLKAGPVLAACLPRPQRCRCLWLTSLRGPGSPEAGGARERGAFISAPRNAHAKDPSLGP